MSDKIPSVSPPRLELTVTAQPKTDGQKAANTPTPNNDAPRNHNPTGHLNALLSIYGVPLQQRDRVSDTIKLLALLAFFYLSYSGLLTQLMSTLIHADIQAFNQQYLDNASKSSIETLEVMTGIKSVLALLQSFSGGISFVVDIQVQLGQSLSALSEVIDKAWQISLASVAAVEGLKLIHYAAHFSMKSLLVVLFLLLGLALGLKHMAPKISIKLEKLALLGLFLVVFTHIIVPVTIYITASISEHFLQPHKQAIHSQFSELHNTIPKHNANESLHNQVKGINHTYKNKMKNHAKQFASYSSLAARHFIYSVTEFIILPIVIVLFLSHLVRTVIRKEKLLE